MCWQYPCFLIETSSVTRSDYFLLRRYIMSVGTYGSYTEPLYTALGSSIVIGLSVLCRYQYDMMIRLDQEVWPWPGSSYLSSCIQQSTSVEVAKHVASCKTLWTQIGTLLDSVWRLVYVILNTFVTVFTHAQIIWYFKKSYDIPYKIYVTLRNFIWHHTHLYDIARTHTKSQMVKVWYHMFQLRFLHKLREYCLHMRHSLQWMWPFYPVYSWVITSLLLFW